MIFFCVTIILFGIAAMDVSENIKFSIKNEKIRIIIYLGVIICGVIEYIGDIKFLWGLLF